MDGIEQYTATQIVDELAKRYRNVVVLVEGPQAGEPDYDEMKRSVRGSFSAALGMVERLRMGLRSEARGAIDDQTEIDESDGDGEIE